ncbi:EF-hand domain-containing protein [Actinomadura parmotrematis]|uniref:EF-hand domain-containing protein n=1 Tax=Actinomadura parmotrematis TaxID=2864039 RepID=A0ABS7FQ37_9ACTN|nr:EF-hand domain-containing protein [Actinomadura parmotrematis]MBW8482497.1 EF-hand domain-containing protein [Actinomadura parmotrematis]
MASDFQYSKIALVFAAMDRDGDGYLTEADFATLAARWTALRGAPPGTPEHARLHAVMTGWWDTLAATADTRHPGRVSPADVLRVVDHLAEMPDAVAATAEAMFEAVDENGDDRVSRAEYRRLIEAWNGRPTDTDATFDRLDLDGDGHLSRAEFTLLWAQFWAGDDPAAPGTWVFGPLDLRALA